ncbi:MAG: hypothetical protein HY959_12760 [Ignavibacteriae bacterium]|nr:hypothetical protein [Ignavibacteriota bacterium]
MRIKNIIILIFILFNLNLYYQPAPVNPVKYRHTIVRQIDQEEDKLTFNIIKNNKEYLFRELISIKILILMTDGNPEIFNTS